MTETPIQLNQLDGYDVWLRQSGESAQWYGRFWRYCQLGTERSLLAIYRLHRAEQQLQQPESGNQRAPRRLRVPSSWQAASVRYRWKERANAWDLCQQQKDIEQWNQRFSQHREELWTMREQLLERVRNMLAWPIADQEVETQNADGSRQRVLIRGSGWKQTDLHKAVELVESLGRSAIGDINAAIALVQSMGYRVVDDRPTSNDDSEAIALDDLFGDI